MIASRWLWRTGSVLLGFGGTLLLAASPAHAVQASPRPVTVKQPDGTEIKLYIRGDEFLNFYEDERGYTVIRREIPPPKDRRPAAAARDAGRDQGGWYSYATLGPEGRLVATDLKVGVDPPQDAGLAPRIRPRDNQATPRALARSRATEAARVRPQGDVPNLVILMRFADHSGRAAPSPSDYDVIFNKAGGDPQLAPTGSVRDVYLQNSYNTMRLNSRVVGWVDLPQTEAFYADGDSGLTGRFAEAIRAALDQLDAQVNFKNFDRDVDGQIDAIAFIHSGYGAEWGGEDQDGVDFKHRIWSHQFNIPTWTSQEGVRVRDYHVSTGFWDVQGSEPTHIGVVAHETGHFFGLPDLYDYSDFGSGLGAWSMMANSWGFDGTQQHPPHFDAWSKVQLGWVQPTILTASGMFDAPAVETSPTIFKVAADYRSATEYLLIENRQPIGYDSKMPSGNGGNGGLAIYHIDETKPRNDQPGFSGQSGWPQNNLHYKIALLQADGQFHLERSSQLSQADRRLHGNGDGTDLFRAGHVTQISHTTTPNTNGYQGGVIRRPGHRISSISATGRTMRFRFTKPPSPTLESDDVPVVQDGSAGRGVSAQVSIREGGDPKNLLRLTIQLDRPLEVQITIKANQDLSVREAGDEPEAGSGDEPQEESGNGSAGGAVDEPRSGVETEPADTPSTPAQPKPSTDRKSDELAPYPRRP